MKKIGLFLISLLLFSIPAFAEWTAENEEGCTNAHYVGALTYYTSIYGTNGLATIYDDYQFVNPPAISSYVYRNGQSQAAFTRASLLNATSTLYSLNLDNNIGLAPRAVTVQISSANVVTGRGDTINGTLTLYGWNAKGVEVSEAISISTNSTTANVAWMTISTWTITLSSASQSNGANVNPLYLWIGSSDKLGLSNNISAATDVVDIVEGTTHRNPGSATISALYDTIIPQTATDGSVDYNFRYITHGR